MNTKQTYDVIVIGAGHAGIEAAYSAARMGSKTLLITLDLDKIGLMPCNPAIGGVGKGHMVFEIAAFGGLMPQLCTKTYLQARMLNTRKGPAVQGLRLQIDKYAYSKLSRMILEQTPNLSLFAGMVEDIIVDEHNTVQGLRTQDGTEFTAKTVIITSGTFLNGVIHIGKDNYPAGRREEKAVTGLSKFLARVGLQLGRLKTGTPPRILRSSINFDALEFQVPDSLDYLFEFYPHKVQNSRDCYIGHTNERTHEIIRKNLHLSAMYSGNIVGIGPRYCPSIEDKIARFADKTSHHIFVEPEGADDHEIYPNGISTSLPLEIQNEYVRSIKGFENAIITKPGYAVEYDFVMPHQLHHNLQVKTVPGLFLAGQINGTTGYEEAAGQGLIAGINAHLSAHNLAPFILERTESYIGIMIDDLVTMGVDEPYRMFTSRAERRLLLRQDNTFLRLMPKAYTLGLIEQSVYDDFLKEKELIEQVTTTIQKNKKTEFIINLFDSNADVQTLREHTHKDLSARALQTVHAQVRYAPYLEREEKEVEKTKQFKELAIPTDMVYTNLPGLSKELQQKLNKYRPATIAQAALIQGMTPAAISLLILHTRRKLREKSK